MPTIYSYPALLLPTDPTFQVFNDDYSAVVAENFSGNKPHMQGPRGGDPYNNLTPGTRIVFDAGNPNFVSVEELFAGRKGKPFSAGGNRSYVRRFRVIVNNNRIGPCGVAGCPGIPLPYAPYIPNRREEWDKQALAVDIDAEPELGDVWTNWVVTVTYSTDMPPGGPMFLKTGLGNADAGCQLYPWEEPPHLEWDVESETVVPNQDLLKKAFVNAAGQPFTPPFSHPTGYRSIVVSRNEKADTFENRAEDYIYVVNSVTFKGYPPGYVLCTGGRGALAWLGTTAYYRVTYRLLCKKRVDHGDGSFSAGWQPRILNAGMFQRKTLFGIDDVIGETLVPIVKFKIPVNQPVLLDADGHEQTAVDGGGNLVPTWIDFKTFREVDLNELITF